MIKILLAGVGSLRNYGCEAIVRGTYQILCSCMKNFRLTIAVKNKEEARGILQDLPEIDIVEDSNRFSLYRIYKGILRRIFHIGNGSPLRLRTSLAAKYDIFLLGGGDNICEAPGGGLYNLCIDLLKMGQIAAENKKHFVLWGASSGPFSAENVRVISKSLQYASAICLREELSLSYIKSILPKEKIHFFADPAFAFQVPISVEKEHIRRIGLNLSPLAAEQYSSHLEAFCKKFSEWLEWNKIEELVLIPHVMSAMSGAQNDYLFLIDIQRRLQRHTSQINIRLLSANIGAVRTKQVVSTVDFLIASRMHCCVAGASIGIPTLFVTYSPKGEGMCNYVYNGEFPSFPVQTLFSASFFGLLQKLYESRERMHSILEERKSLFLSEAIASGKLLASLEK